MLKYFGRFSVVSKALEEIIQELATGLSRNGRRQVRLVHDTANLLKNSRQS